MLGVDPNVPVLYAGGQRCRQKERMDPSRHKTRNIQDLGYEKASSMSRRKKKLRAGGSRECQTRMGCFRATGSCATSSTLRGGRPKKKGRA